MNARIVIIALAAAAGMIAAYGLLAGTQETVQNEKLGLVVNAPKSEITLQELDGIYQKAASSGVGRSNVYMFWDIIEPERDRYDWGQYDRLVELNEKYGMKVTLYLSVINGKTLGPFPDWIGNPSIKSIPGGPLADVLDTILARYDAIDYVVIAAGTDEHFRYQQGDIPVYEELFGEVYGEVKERHPDVKIGNSFELHNALNKNLADTIRQLAFGDFVAFTYLPTNTLYEIDKTPGQARQDLEAIAEIVPGKRIAILEAGWSTSGRIGGGDGDQAGFIGELYDYYDQNAQDVEFLTWYRLYDRPEGTCMIDESDIEDRVTLGNSTFVIQRLGDYICSAGMIKVDGTAKASWAEFAGQIKKRSP